jgi:hypothetical protein
MMNETNRDKYTPEKLEKDIDEIKKELETMSLFIRVLFVVIIASYVYAWWTT